MAPVETGAAVQQDPEQLHSQLSLSLTCQGESPVTHGLPILDKLDLSYVLKPVIFSKTNKSHETG